jgi:hypothetical protein
MELLIVPSYGIATNPIHFDQSVISMKTVFQIHKG